MNSPKGITIKFEINVPGGIDSDLGQLGCKEKTAMKNWVGAHDPATGMTITNGCDLCVHPQPGANLGTVAISFTYPTAMTDVVAVTYPIGLAHSDDNPPVVGTVAKRGTSIDNKTWTWSGSNEVFGADYCATLHQRLNKLYLWTSVDNQHTWQADEPLSFYGYCGPDGPCISGSSGSIGMFTAGRPILKLRVPSGPGAGEYPARCVGSLQWEAVIGGVAYAINLSPDGTAAFLSSPASAVRAKSAGVTPYCAVFPGSIFGVANDVLVWQE